MDEERPCSLAARHWERAKMKRWEGARNGGGAELPVPRPIWTPCAAPNPSVIPVLMSFHISIQLRLVTAISVFQPSQRPDDNWFPRPAIHLSFCQQLWPMLMMKGWGLESLKAGCCWICFIPSTEPFSVSAWTEYLTPIKWFPAPLIAPQIVLWLLPSLTAIIVLTWCSLNFQFFTIKWSSLVSSHCFISHLFLSKTLFPTKRKSKTVWIQIPCPTVRWHLCTEMCFPVYSIVLCFFFC